MTEPLRYVPAGSVLHRMPAAAKVVGLVACVTLVCMAEGPVALGLCGLGCVGLAVLSRAGLARALRPAWGLRWFALLVLALNALLFSDVDPVWSLGFLHLTWAGLAQGARIAARVLEVVVLGAVLTLTTRPQELVGGVRTLLSPLARLGANTEPVALAVGIAMQFVPTLLRECRSLIKAQSARGLGSQSGIVEQVRGFVRLLVPVFVAAFRRADELSLAMEARGYRPDRAAARREDGSVS